MGRSAALGGVAAATRHRPARLAYPPEIVQLACSSCTEVLAPVAELGEGRVQVIDPMSTKGLEYDATVVVDPDEITRESPGGIRVLYVALTRAAHRMTILS